MGEEEIVTDVPASEEGEAIETPVAEEAEEEVKEEEVA